MDDPDTLEEWVDAARERLERRYGRRRRSAGSGARSAASSRQRSARRAKHRRNRYRRGLYRDPDRAKVWGICAGLSDYFGVEVWQMRVCAVLGLMFLPQLTATGYIIGYFVLDKKPYYRRMTDRFDRAMGIDPADDPSLDEEYAEERADWEDEAKMAKSKKRQRERRPQPPVPNATALRTARDKFATLEERVRAMESHVTSSQFELQRELNKISGEGRA